MADKETPKWRDRFEVLAPEDHDVLEANAAQHEFRGRMSKEDSEERAHQDYLKDHAIGSAAFHYLGMRAATAANHQKASKQHGEAYSLAMKHLGLNPLETPPKEVLERTKDIEKSPYKFSPHQADDFFAPKLPEAPKPTEKQKTLELVEKLKSLRAPNYK
jgi:hypothetical protein